MEEVFLCITTVTKDILATEFPVSYLFHSNFVVKVLLIPFCLEQVHVLFIQ